MIWPASQPAIAPITSQMIKPSIVMTIPPHNVERPHIVRVFVCDPDRRANSEHRLMQQAEERKSLDGLNGKACHSGGDRGAGRCRELSNGNSSGDDPHMPTLCGIRISRCVKP